MAINDVELVVTIRTDWEEILSNQPAPPICMDSSFGVHTAFSKGKRLIDILMGSILMILFSPLFIVLMIIVRLDSPGLVFFSQKRLGLYGKNFCCYKFRTMYENNQPILEKHFEDNPTNKDSWIKYAKLKDNDPRVTRSGKWLRRWSLDELPQLINVIKGEMSLVGPRPYLPSERSAMRSKDDIILSVLPGITGLWQVSGRNEIDFPGRLYLEHWYVLNHSLRLDIAILCRTLPAVLSKKGAY